MSPKLYKIRSRTLEELPDLNQINKNITEIKDYHTHIYNDLNILTHNYKNINKLTNLLNSKDNLTNQEDQPSDLNKYGYEIKKRYCEDLNKFLNKLIYSIKKITVQYEETYKNKDMMQQRTEWYSQRIPLIVTAEVDPASINKYYTTTYEIMEHIGEYMNNVRHLDTHIAFNDDLFNIMRLPPFPIYGEVYNKKLKMYMPFVIDYTKTDERITTLKQYYCLYKRISILFAEDVDKQKIISFIWKIAKGN